MVKNAKTKSSLILISMLIVAIIISGCIGEEPNTKSVANDINTNSNTPASTPVQTVSKDINTLVGDLMSAKQNVRQEAADSLEQLGWDDKSNTGYIYYLMIKKKSDELERMGIDPIVTALKDDVNGIHDKSVAIDVLDKLGWKPRTAVTGSTFDKNSYMTGEGSISVDNGLGWDALVVLSKESNKDDIVRATYVQAKNKWTISQIPDGRYKLYFKLGKDWDNNERKFLIVPGRTKFDDVFVFDTTPDWKGDSYTQAFSVTLHEVSGGNAQTENIDESEFPTVN